MIATFYKTKSDNLVVNKMLDELFTLDNIVWKEDTSEFEPTITFRKVDNWRGCNYCKMNMYGKEKYFYITELVLCKGGILEAHLHVDVLMTYSSYIREINTIVTRQEKLPNSSQDPTGISRNIFDNRIALPTNRVVERIDVGNVGSDNASIILTVSN